MQIEFIETREKIGLLNCQPKPANKLLPEWYKTAPLFCAKSEKVKNCPHVACSAPNTTYKNCTPFLDALSTGYIFESPVDVQFTLLANNAIEWNSRIFGNLTDLVGPIMSIHSFNQYPNLPNLNSVYEKPFVFKWQTGYSIKTPKGYSTLYTHPINRYELPFRLLTGVVDTDKYQNEVLFPFQITHKFKEPGDVLIIEKGTPICQVIPFKRDNWKSSIKPYDKDYTMGRSLIYWSKIVNAYKSRYWSKKKYD